MNANNLMAVSPANGIAGTGAQNGRAVTPANRAQTTSGKNSFSDTFDALQKENPSDATRTEVHTGAQAEGQINPASAKENVPSQNPQEVTAETPKNADKMSAQPQEQNDAAEAGATAAEASVVAAALNALLQLDVSDTSVDEGLDPALSEILARYDLTVEQLTDAKAKTTLQGLVQEMPEEVLKNQNFLRILAGQQLTQPNDAGEMPILNETAAPAMEEFASIQRMAGGEMPIAAPLRASSVPENVPDAHEVPVVDGNGLTQTRAAQQSIPVQGQTAQAAETIAAPVAQMTQNTQVRSVSALVGETLQTDETASESPDPLTVLAQRTMRHDTQGQGASYEEQQSSSQQMPFRPLVDTALENVPRAAEQPSQTPQPAAIQSGAPLPQPVQIVSETTPVEAPQQAQTEHEIPRQIVEQARLLRTLNDTQMVIRLKPEHLGELTLRVSIGSDGAVQASFHSDNAHVRNLIENSLVQLRQELNNQGLKVDRVGVYTGLADGQMPQGQGQEAWQQSGNSRGETQVYPRGDADDYLDDLDGIAPISAHETEGGSVNAEGVDYRV